MPIQKADPKFRRRILLILAAVLILLLALITLGYPALQTRLLEMPRDEALKVMGTVFDALAVALVLTLLPLAHVAFKTIKSQRFPPPGVRTIRDQKILEGAAALRRGRLMLAMLAVIVILIFFVTLTAHRLLDSLASGG